MQELLTLVKNRNEVKMDKDHEIDSLLEKINLSLNTRLQQQIEKKRIYNAKTCELARRYVVL